jgi:hypothetical protein
VALVVRNGGLVQIHPICSNCFEKCSFGHEFGYGERCNVCGEVRRRINLIRHNLDPDDPTFGLTATGSNTNYPNYTFGAASTANYGSHSNMILTHKVTLSEPATVYQLEEQFQTVGTGCNFRMAIYSDSAGEPVNVLVESASVAAAAGWSTVAVTRTYLAAGTYHLAEQLSTAAGAPYFQTVTSGIAHYKTWTYGAFQNPLVTPVNYTDGFSCLARYNRIKNYAKATKAALSEGAACNSVSFYSHATGNVRLAIYNQSGAAPNAKQWESGSGACSATAWKTINISDGTPNSLTLATGTYWLAWQWDSVNAGPSYTAGAAGDGHYLSQAYGAFPATWAGTASTEKWSEYVTYTVSTVYVNVTDSGSGTEAPKLGQTLTDGGAGSDLFPSLQNLNSDNGAGQDVAALQAQIPLTDSGNGADVWNAVETWDISDSAMGDDVIGELTAAFTVTESGGLSLEIISTSDLSWLDSSDSGIGTDVVGSITVIVTDAESSGLDEVVSLDRMFLDEGSGSEEPFISFSVEDSGVGDEGWIIEASFMVSDVGSGTDYWWSGQAFIDQSDSGVGVESFLSFQVTFTVTDANGTTFESIDAMLSPLIMYDSAIGAEFAWRLKGSCLLDDFTLPHVLTIRGVDEAAIADKKLHPPTLPRRKMVGKPGRTVEIQGWTDSQAEIDDMENLFDGSKRLFVHPSGDSFMVILTDFDPGSPTDAYHHRIWRMTLKETR